MMIAPPKSYADCANSVLEVASAALDIRKGLGHPDADARSIALNNIQMVCESSLMSLNLCHNWATSPGVDRVKYLNLLGINTLSQELVDRYAYAFLKTAKNSFIVLTLFQVENLLRALVREIGVQNARDGIYSLVTKILNEVGLALTLRDPIIALANIRNSLHQNGIFFSSNGNEYYEIDGVVFEFTQGKAVDCADWHHISHLQKGTLKALEAILRSQRVLGISTPMHEEYFTQRHADRP